MVNVKIKILSLLLICMSVGCANMKEENAPSKIIEDWHYKPFKEVDLTSIGFVKADVDNIRIFMNLALKEPDGSFHKELVFDELLYKKETGIKYYFFHIRTQKNIRAVIMVDANNNIVDNFFISSTVH